MKSLILFLFLGATVALAEIHVDNDPHHIHRILSLVSLNSLPSFCFVANFLKCRFKEHFTINSLSLQIVFNGLKWDY